MAKDAGGILVALATGLLLVMLLPTRFTPVLLMIAPLLPALALDDRRALAGWLAAGVIYGLVWQGWVHSLRPTVDSGDAVMVTGRVVTLPEAVHGRQRFLLRPAAIEGRRGGLPRRIRVSIYAPTPRVSAGERWRMKLRLRRPRGFMNPVRFDYERWLASRHIDATAYLVAPESAERLTPATGLVHWRSVLSERIGDMSGTDGPGRALLQGLVTGDRRAFTDGIWDVLRATGTSHLMAISGLHIGLMAAAGYGLGGRLWAWLRLPGRRRLTATLTAFSAAGAYAALAGFALPTTRALVMFAVLAFAALAGRRVAPVRLLLLAAVVLLLLDPASVLSAGFWLSFLAVALIIMVARGRRLGRLNGLWQIQIGLLVGLAPISGLFFGSWSPLGLLANLVLLPLFSLIIVPVALIGTASGLVWPHGGGILLGAAAGLLNRLMAAGDWLLAKGMTEWPLDPAGFWTWLSMAAALILLLAPSGTPLRPLALPMALTFFLAEPRGLPRGSVEVTWLEVGQGNSAVIRTAHHIQVIDTGPAWSGGGNAAAFTLLPFLADRGIRTVDRLIVTHADRDHRGGLNALDSAVAIRRIDAGEPLADFPEARACRAGIQWSVDGIRFRYLWPDRAHRSEGNEASCVLLMEAPGGRVLFTGDIDAAIEARIAADLNAPVTVIEAPHHGSRTGSSDALLDAAQPAHAVVSAGFRNPYGMPHAETIARLRCRRIRVHDLGRTGSLRLLLAPEEPPTVWGMRPHRGRLSHESPALRRFRAGRQIHYDRRHYAVLDGEIDQPTCGN
ncbi:DNA internalization-related competence protein ComEC/Rec2 [Spiribacter sp. 221]|uniref:DNA internalization-related competence protein ComEC/Rec2 n=1 Tax=Spiribacter onubensis TaxID=3122420 RepID=UPI00349F40CC